MLDTFKSSFFVASGAFASSLVFTKGLKSHCTVDSKNWMWQSLFGTIGVVSGAWMGSKLLKQSVQK